MSKERILVTNIRSRNTYRNITFNSTFFNDENEYIFKETEDSITVTRAPMDYRGKTLKGGRKGHNCVQFCLVSEIPLGEYKINPDDKDEDSITIYF